MITPEKDLCDLTFDELVSALTWELASSIIKGKELRSTVFLLCDMAIRWRREQDKKVRTNDDR